MVKMGRIISINRMSKFKDERGNEYEDEGASASCGKPFWGANFRRSHDLVGFAESPPYRLAIEFGR
jgi:hypothetical protein